MSPLPPPSPTLAAIVVAGGAARRMGGVDKLALDVAGRPLLDRVLGAAAEVCDVVVVVGPGRPTGVAGVLSTIEPEPGGGPVPAVAAGLAMVPEAAAVVVLAADLALLTADHLRLLMTGLRDPNAVTGLRDPNAVTGLRNPNAVTGLRDPNAVTGLRGPNAVTGLDDAGVTAVAAGDERGPNPLLAAHGATALRERLAALGPDLRGIAAARLLPPDVVTVDLGADAVLNVNRHEDLERARAIAGRRP